MGDAMTFTRCSVTAKLSVTTTRNLGDLDNMADPTDILDMTLTDSLADGRGEDAGNLLYFTSGSIAASGSAAFDLAGTLTDAYGSTVNFDRVKGIFVKNTSTTNGSQINVVDTHGIYSVASGDGVKLIPGTNGAAFMYIFTPDATAWDVTATSKDTITLNNIDSSNIATYQIAVIGAEIDSSSSSSSPSSSSSSSSSSDSSSSTAAQNSSSSST